MFRLTIAVANLGGLIALAEVLQDNGFDAETDAPFMAVVPAAAPAGVPMPPSASAPEEPKKGGPKKKDKPAAAPVALTQAEIDEPVSPALAALAGGPPLPPAAAPAPPSAPPAAPAAPAASPAAPPTLVDPSAYVAPAAVTLEALQAAMANYLGSGKSAMQAQAFLLETTGHKALKDLPVEWYPRAHWCLATGVVPA